MINDKSEGMLYPQYEEKSLTANEPAVTKHRRVGRRVLTPSQLYLLRVFERDNTEETAKAIQTWVYRYYQQKMDEELDELWDAGILDQAKLNQYRQMHIRDILR